MPEAVSRDLWAMPVEITAYPGKIGRCRFIRIAWYEEQKFCGHEVRASCLISRRAGFAHNGSKQGEGFVRVLAVARHRDLGGIPLGPPRDPNKGKDHQKHRNPGL